MWILRSKSASSQLMHGDMRLPRVGHDLARYDHESTHYRYTTALHIPIEFNGAAPGDDSWNHPSVIPDPPLGSYDLPIELSRMTPFNAAPFVHTAGIQNEAGHSFLVVMTNLCIP